MDNNPLYIKENTLWWQCLKPFLLSPHITCHILQKSLKSGSSNIPYRPFLTSYLIIYHPVNAKSALKGALGGGGKYEQTEAKLYTPRKAKFLPSGAQIHYLVQASEDLKKGQLFKLPYISRSFPIALISFSRYIRMVVQKM